MKVTWTHFFALVILIHAFVWAQLPSNSSSPTLAYENGSITNNVYTNECFGISLAIPDGWQLNKLVNLDGKARHMPGGELALLILDQHKEGAFGNRIVVTAHDANGSVLSVKDFVSNAAHGQVNLDREHREILKDVYPAGYGGKHFYRADYKQSFRNGSALYQSFVYTIFRGYYIGETLMAESPGELELAVNSLQGITFQEDEPNPKCVMKGDDSSNSGVILGVISSKHNMSQPSSGMPQRVRVSQAVSAGMLIKKVEPQYPGDVGKIQGQVVLHAVINKDGVVENLALVSGHPMLVSSAIEAAKQWKYKPYLLNGQPVEMETVITVAFQPSEP